MFVYCTQVLHLSEFQAYLRINVARASRKHPKLLEMLSDGRLQLSGIDKLAPILTDENRKDAPEAGHAPLQAGDRETRGRSSAQARRAGNDAQAACAPSRRTGRRLSD